MERSQADAIARALLGPDVEAQEELRRKRHAEAQSLAERRKVAWFMLAGVLIGAGIAHFGTGDRFTVGAVWGGMSASAVGWLLVAWARHRSVP